MCERALDRVTRRTVALAICVLAGVPAVSAAQSTAEARQELDSLLPQWRAANARVAEAERTRRRTAGATWIERGYLRILADSSLAKRVAEAADEASASLERVFGEDARRVTDHSIVVQQNRARQAKAPPLIRVRWSASDSQRRENNALGFPRDMERHVAGDTSTDARAALVVALEAVGAAPLHALLDEELRAWFRSAMPATGESGDELAGIYVDLTTASTDISRRCLDGDLAGCRQLLGLAPVADPVLQAFTATQRRTIVAGHSQLLRTPAKAAEFDRCAVGMDDGACVNRLRELSEENLFLSLSTTALRRSFARWALAHGGAGAYTRLREATGRTIEQRFAIAAAMPADSLVSSWRTHVMSASPPTSTIPPLTAVATLLWIGACGALSLRSSRWR